MSYQEKLCKILHTKDIKEDNLPYYYTKYPEWNPVYKVEPMFDNIEPYQYYQPIEKLNYSQDILDIAKDISGDTVRDSSQEIDQIILEYIKCRPKCSVLMMRHKKMNPELLNYLSKNGNIYYIKHIKLSFNATKALIYQIYADTDKHKKLDDIEKYLNDVFKFDKNGGYITVIVFDNIGDKPFNLIKLDINRLMIKRNAFYMTTLHYRAIEYAQLYFCENSLKFLEKQLLERHLEVYMRKSRILLGTFKRWLCQNINLKDRRGFMIFSGCVLYIYGLRNIHDIDLYIDGECHNQEIDKYLLNEKSKFYFVDTIMENTHTWKNYWDNWSIKWANMLGAQKFNELIYNPKYHFYYMGLKFLILEGDIERRSIRQRPRAYVDLIKINELLNFNIKLPAVPKTQLKYIRLTKDQPEPDELEENQKYNKNNREIETKVKIDLDRFLATMQWYFKTMYHEEHSIIELKKIFGIRKIHIKKN